jgi:trigger factor
LETNYITLDLCTQDVEITLSNHELQPHYNKAYTEAAKLIEVPGFRKGKVPLPIIKQRFGRSIENEALENIANEEFTTIARRDNLRVLGNPSLRDIRKDPNGVTFVIRYEIIPNFQLGEYKNLNLVKPSYTITDEDVTREIDEMLLRTSTFEPAEQITDYMHLVKVKFITLDDETNMPVLSEKPHEEEFFLDNEEVDDDLKSSLLNARVGDTFNYVAPAQDEETLPLRYMCSVVEIQKVVPAEFTNEFVEKYTKGRLTTTEQLREDLRTYMQQTHEKKSREAIENQIFDILVDSHDFAVPESLIRTVSKAMFDDFKERLGKDAPQSKSMKFEAMADIFRAPAMRNARWEIIYNRIIEEEALDITDDDLKVYFDVYRKQGDNFTDDQLREYFLSEQRIIGPILMRKMYDRVIEEALLTEIPLDEYLRQQEEQNLLQQQFNALEGHDHNHEGHDHNHEGHDHNHEEHDHNHEEHQH